MKNLKSRFSYRKFGEPPYKILYLDDDYFLQRASIEALKKLGHQVEVISVKQDPGYMLEQILKRAVFCKPDCIMSVNHAGFDEEGKIASILNELQIPVLQWYLDDFRFIILNTHAHANDWTAIYTFEGGHVKRLQESGYAHVFYLPSAAAVDPNGDYRHGQYDSYNTSTVFIGSTFNASKKKRYRPRYPKLASRLAGEVDLTQLQHSLVDQISGLQGKVFQNSHDLYHYASYAICYATEIYRRHWLSQVRAKDFQLFGDRDWRQGNITATFHEPVDNITAAPHIQRHALVNLCLSSQQLGSAVSLRAYDIPASGGFLLTDWKTDLAELFAEDEVVSFRSVAEMNDKIAYFEKHPGKRLPIIERARERVLKHHQVIHRMEKMIEIAAETDW